MDQSLASQLLHYACVARASYGKHATPAQQLACLGYQQESEWQGDDGQLYAVAAGNAAELVVSIQGTRDLREVMLDAEVRMRRFYGSAFPDAQLVHDGFLTYWEAMSAWALGLDRGTRRLVVACHSLGAAVATLMACSRKVDAVWTFGSPRVGMPMFTARYASLPTDTYRVVHAEDLVPHLPGWPYYHVAGERVHAIALTGDGQEAEIPPEDADSREVHLLADLDGQAIRDHAIQAYIDCASSAVEHLRTGAPT